MDNNQQQPDHAANLLLYLASWIPVLISNAPLILQCSSLLLGMVVMWETYKARRLENKERRKRLEENDKGN